ncbi:ABC transporter permease [Pseudorhodobacter turbinis]|uniref:ABC transporter permease n=1 Tax=Pseudorhodobacter turbinis TaxID=2500533 RepID=A0A4P8EEG6_9RHOB|nr:ABC transporter permease [Pseudorhodobacter turbinis]QCO55451.1 ABC transporter permease [Pseudorhodobacter turbinis]
MAGFIAKRLGFGLMVLFTLSIFVFFLFFVAPGDPARIVAGEKASAAQLEQVRQNLGLDKPMIEQYFRFAGRALQGDLGFSYRNQQPVTEIILRRIPATLSLVLGGVVFWLALGVPIGIMSARYPGTWKDRAGQVFILLGLSFPTFVLGMLSLYTLYFLPRKAGFTLFPPGGYRPLLDDPLIWAWYLALPWMTLALVTAAIYARLTRGQLLQVLSEDYIRTARAKGLSERKVVYKHGLRATLTPLVTQLGADIAILLGGAIVIEQVYGLQGVGALAVQAVRNQDRPIIIGVVLMGGLFIVLSNIVVDLLYAALDPRMR